MPFSDLRYKNKGLHAAIFHSLMDKVFLPSLLKFMKVTAGFISCLIPIKYYVV